MPLFSRLLPCVSGLIGLLAALILLTQAVGAQVGGEVLGLNVTTTHALQLYLLDIQHNLLHNLTHADRDQLQLNWSPDGETIAFVAEQNGQRSLQIMNANGGNLRDFSQYRRVNYPVWLPDSQHVIFAGEAPEGESSNIYLLDTRADQMISLTDGNTEDKMPHISADGTQVVFVSDRDGYQNLYRLNLATGDATQITASAEPKAWPRWSPDGTQIAFAARAGSYFRMQLISADGQNQISLLHSPLRIPPYFAWSPDGEKIATSLANGRVAIINVKTGVVRGIINPYEQSRVASWSADSQRLIYTGRIGKLAYIIITDPLGNTIYEWSTRAFSSIHQPVWKPG